MAPIILLLPFTGAAFLMLRRQPVGAVITATGLLWVATGSLFPFAIARFGLPVWLTGSGIAAADVQATGNATGLFTLGAILVLLGCCHGGLVRGGYVPPRRNVVVAGFWTLHAGMALVIGLLLSTFRGIAPGPAAAPMASAALAMIGAGFIMIAVALIRSLIRGRHPA